MNKIKQHNLKEDIEGPSIDVNIFTKSQVTKIVKSNDNDRTYLVGCLDGSVHLLNTTDLQPISRIFANLQVEDESADSTQVNDMYADD